MLSFVGIIVEVIEESVLLLVERGLIICDIEVEHKWEKIDSMRYRFVDSDLNYNPH